MTTIKQDALDLAKNISNINRFCSENHAAKLIIKELIKQFKKNPNIDYWHELDLQLDLLSGND